MELLNRGRRAGEGDVAVYLGDVAQHAAAQQHALSGAYRLVYVTPEKLDQNQQVRAQLAALHAQHRVRLVAVDEAHLVFEWAGFRNAYTRIGDFCSRVLPGVPKVAHLTPFLTLTLSLSLSLSLSLTLILTRRWHSRRPRRRTSDPTSSTCCTWRTPPARRTRRCCCPPPTLSLSPNPKPNPKPEPKPKPTRKPKPEPDPKPSQVLPTSRPNLQLSVLERRDRQSSLGWLVSELKGQSQLTLIYVPSAPTAREVAGYFKSHGLRARCYYKDLPEAERAEALRDFMATGAAGLDVLVATVAFGMGIDNPRVRIVVHYGPRPNLYP